jgi:hypothetical protein
MLCVNLVKARVDLAEYIVQMTLYFKILFEKNTMLQDDKFNIT